MENIRSILFFKKQEESKVESERNKNLIKLLEADLDYRVRESDKMSTSKIIVNEIKIFIASQSVLTEERDFIDDLIRKKNDDFIKKGIYLKPIRWEDEDKGNSGDRKQNEFNGLLLDSEIAIYLTWDSIGHYTKEEFEIGYNNMKKGAKPFRIYVFNKTVPQKGEDMLLQGMQDYRDLKKKFQEEGKIIVDYVEKIILKKEIDSLFSYIENNYLSDRY